MSQQKLKPIVPFKIKGLQAFLSLLPLDTMLFLLSLLCLVQAISRINILSIFVGIDTSLNFGSQNRVITIYFH